MKAEAKIDVNFGPLEIILRPAPPLPEVLANVTSTIGGITMTAKGVTAMAYILPDDKQVTVQIAYTDKHGNPAKVDGNVEWASSDEGIATVTADGADSTRAVITSGDDGTIGVAQISARADADVGSGVTDLITTFDVEIVAGAAVAGTITPVGEAEPIPGPSPTPQPQP